MSGLYIVTLLIYLYAEYIMRNAELDEAKAQTKGKLFQMNQLQQQTML